MAIKQPLAGDGLFTTPAEQYGWVDEEQDTNLITRFRGSNQFLGRQANHHDDQSTVGPSGNRLQSGMLPRAKSGPVSSPSRANPLGSETSLNG